MLVTVLHINYTMWSVFFTFGVCTLVLSQIDLTVAGKSDDKCNEYIQFEKSTRNKRDLGKIQASPDEFPHMAGVLYGEDNELKCGGSLISDQYILTAAHCTTLRDARSQPMKVRLGSNDISKSKNTANIQEISISKVIKHPDYKPPSKYNDIALLKLEHKVNFTKSVRPACLQTDPNLNVNFVIGTGWGVTSFQGEPSSELLKVRLELFTNEECQKTYDSSRRLANGITDTMICSGGKTESKATCQGDAGGPLQILHQDQTDIYNIVGIISFGKACGVIGIPEVATRVSSYIPWIESVVWP